MDKANQSFSSSTYCASFGIEQLKLYFKRIILRMATKKIIYLKINLSKNKPYQYEKMHNNLLINISHERPKKIRGIKIL